jgi:hypothetical protein
MIVARITFQKLSMSGYPTKMKPTVSCGTLPGSGDGLDFVKYQDVVVGKTFDRLGLHLVTSVQPEL